MKDTLTKSWEIGPFTRVSDQPIIRPMPELVFDCPMRKKVVHWADNHTFNPAAIVRDGKVCLLFRAEDGSEIETDRLGQFTSRIGLAVSSDGVNFDIHPEPVFYPDDDEWVANEWFGGCEDPRVVEAPDGSYALYYTMFNRDNPCGEHKRAIIGVATSTDLVHWKKYGPIFTGKDAPDVTFPHKAAGVVQEIKDGRLVAARINGKYWMYWGPHAGRIAWSDDLISWTPVTNDDGSYAEPLKPRKGHFDTLLAEVGPPPILTEDGIVLLYNGKNGKNNDGDPSLGPHAYAAGQALFDKNDPTRLLDRLDTPFIRPELEFERIGQNSSGVVFIEGLVIFEDKWHLYYGTADSLIGVATAPYR